MKKVGLLLFPGFSEFEVTVALSLVPLAMHEVMTLALDENIVKSEAGLLCQTHRKLSDIEPADLEVLIVPGGDIGYFKDAGPLFAFVREPHEQEKLLAAICSGPYVLSISRLYSRAWPRLPAL